MLDGFADLGFDFGAVAGIEAAGAFHDGVEVVLGGFGKRKGGGRESGDFFAVDNHGDNEMAVVHLDEIAFVKGRLELLGEDGGVVGGDAEGDGGADVAKDSVTDGVGHLGDVLVGNGEIEAVFAGFGEDDGEGVGGEVLELVNIEIEWAAIGDVGDVGAAHGGELDLGDEEGAEDGGVIFADQTFGEIDDEDLPFVHDFADVETGFGLADDVADDGVGGEGTDLVENGGDRFVDLLFVPLAEFVLPELEDGDVLAVIEGFFAEIFVGEHAGDVEEGGLGAVEEGEQGVAQDVFEAGAPRVAEHAFEDADDFGADVGLAGGVAEFEGVKGDWVGGVGGVEVDDVLDARGGDEAEVVNGEIAVGVDDAVALVVENIREGEKFEQATFAGTGLADDIDVAGAIATEQAELVVDAAEVGEAEGGDVLVVGGVAGDEGELGGGFGGFGGGPDDVGGLYGGVGEVVN